MMHIHLFDTIFAAAVETPNYTPHSRALMSLDWSFTSPVCTPSSVPTKPASPFQPIDWMTDLDFPVMDESSDEGDEVSTDFIELLSMATGWRRDEALLQRRARRVEENPAEAEIVRAFQQLPLDMAQRHHRRYRRQGGDCPVCGDAPGGAACLKFARIPFCDCFVCRPCMLNYLRVGFQSERFLPVRCINHTSCNNRALDEEFIVELVADDAELLAAYNEAQFRSWLLSHVNRPTEQSRSRGGVFRCPQVDCSYVFHCLPIESANTIFTSRCPECSELMCGQCLNAAHPDISCAELQASKTREVQELLSTVKGLSSDGGAQQCPFCEHVVERTEGCNYMACVCGFAFCYQCGDKLARNYMPFDEGRNACACGSFARG